MSDINENTYPCLEGRVVSIDEYELLTHFMLFTALVKTKTGMVFVVLRTSQGFKSKDGFYVGPQDPPADWRFAAAVRSSKESVVKYLRDEGWKDYEQIIKPIS